MSADAFPFPKSEKPWDKSYPVDIDWGAEIPAKPMGQLFDEAVKKYGNRECISFMGKVLTYKEVGKLADKFAKGLQDQGIGPGSTVGICLPNTPYSVIAYYGALKAGAKVANFDPTSPSEALAQQINDSKTDFMVTTNVKAVLPQVQGTLGTSSLKKIVVCDFADALPGLKKFGLKLLTAFGSKKAPTMKTPSGDKYLSFAKLTKNKGDVKPVDIDVKEVALLQYTGGTTGVPKGAALTHSNLSSNIEQARVWFTGGKETAEQERMLMVLPAFHVFAMTVQMNLSLHIGAKLIMMPKPFDDVVDEKKKSSDGKKFYKKDYIATLKAIHEEKPTIFAAVPALYKTLLDHPRVGEFDLTSIKLPLSGGAAMPEKTMQRWKEKIGSDIVEGYGLSETSPIVIANPINGVKKLGSIGLPIPGTEVAFYDFDKDEFPAGGIKYNGLPGPGVKIEFEGEICLRGPQIMKEYFGRPDETAKVFTKEGFFRTGDIGMMDKDGYVFITDRLKDMVIVNGFKAFPKKIEEAIRQFDGVSEVIVVGQPDEKTGEVVVAFVQPKEGVTLDPSKMVEFLKDKLKDYEVPRASNIEFRDALPLTKIGKPDKKPLKEEVKQRAKAKAPKP